MTMIITQFRRDWKGTELQPLARHLHLPKDARTDTPERIQDAVLKLQAEVKRLWKQIEKPEDIYCASAAVRDDYVALLSLRKYCGQIQDTLTPDQSGTAGFNWLCGAWMRIRFVPHACMPFEKAVERLADIAARYPAPADQNGAPARTVDIAPPAKQPRLKAVTPV